MESLSARRIGEALACLDLAEAQGHEPDECAAARWQCRMLRGEFQRAWAEGDHIRSRGRHDALALWDGQDFVGRRLVIRCLHGLGDAVQFIRYGALVRHRAERITIEAPVALRRLFSALPWANEVISWEDGSSRTFHDWDQQIEVMEFPRALGTTLETIPANIPYLIRDEALIAGAFPALRIGRRPRIGIVWSSGAWNPARSVPPEEFRVLLKNPALAFYSFQRGEGRKGLEALREICPVHDTAEHTEDIAGTAADLIHMDLLVTVDTMLAHLAGALGQKVWTILPFEADWRWMLDRSTSPWYPTMTLFRQPLPGAWNAVIETVAARLAAESFRGGHGEAEEPSTPFFR